MAVAVDADAGSCCRLCPAVLAPPPTPTHLPWVRALSEFPSPAAKARLSLYTNARRPENVPKWRLFIIVACQDIGQARTGDDDVSRDGYLDIF